MKNQEERSEKCNYTSCVNDGIPVEARCPCEDVIKHTNPPFIGVTEAVASNCLYHEYGGSVFKNPYPLSPLLLRQPALSEPASRVGKPLHDLVPFSVSYILFSIFIFVYFR